VRGATRGTWPGALTGLLGVLAVLAACGPAAENETAPLVRTCAVSLAFDPAGLDGEVRLTSPDLDASDGPLRFAAPVRPGAPHTLTVERAPGPFRWRIAVGSQTFLDTDAPLTLLDTDGLEWSYVDVPDCDTGALVLARRDDRDDGATFVLRVERPRDGAALDPARTEVLLDGRAVGASARAEPDAVTLDLNALPPGKHHVSVRAFDTAGRPFEPFDAPFWVDPEPFRWEDAVVYQIVVDRFADAQGRALAPPSRPGLRAGGKLAGVRARLEQGDFEALGINVLWLSPLYDNPEDQRPGIAGGPEPYVGYHGYWPVEPRRIEPEFGTEAELDALVAAAHARGIRVMLDVVLNHVDVTSRVRAEHPERFSDAPCICGAAACPWSTHIESCWFTPYLADVDFRVPGAVHDQVDDALWWIERFDLDGLRVDAVPMMPRLVVRHLEDQLARRFEGLRDRHFLLGETYTGLGGQDWIRWYLGPHGLDGQFDYPFLWALRAALAGNGTALSLLADTFEASRAAWYGSAAVMALTAGNHDVPRFRSEAGETRRAYRRLRLAHTAVYGLPGMPVLYYGDELGLPGGGDPDNRRPMRFEPVLDPAERALRADLERLGRLRRCDWNLRRGEVEWLVRDVDQLAWRRRSSADAVVAQATDVVLNRASAAATVELARPDVPLAAYGQATIQRISAGRIAVTLPPESAAVLVPADSPCAEETP